MIDTKCEKINDMSVEINNCDNEHLETLYKDYNDAVKNLKDSAKETKQAYEWQMKSYENVLEVQRLIFKELKN